MPDAKVVAISTPKAKHSRARRSRNARWSGGYIRTEADGRTQTYWIEKMLKGRRYHVTTRAHTLQDALRELDRFRSDPEVYCSIPTAQPADAAPVRLNDKLIEEYLAFSRDIKKNEPRWVWDKSRYLALWKEALGEVDLRKVSLRDIEPALRGDGAYTRQKKIAVIKALYGWLRKVRHEISPAEDPTLDALPVPQSEPAQWGKVKAFTPQQFEKVRAQVTIPVFADAMTVQAATGWHTTEVVRFAKGGAVEDLPAGTINPDGDLVIVCPLTKGGEPLKTRVSIAAGEAARRLRDAGKLDRKLYDAALREANVKAGFKVGTVSGGRFRHSVATWAINRGASPKDVSAFLGHKSERTTKKFYATHAIPTKVPTLV